MKKFKIGTVMRNPFFLLFCIATGIYLGFYHKELASYLSPIATFYTNLLQITVIPIIAITILTGMSKLLTQGGSNSYVMRIVTVFAVMMIITGVFSALVGFVFQPGKDMANDPSIVRMVEDSGGTRTPEVTLDEPIEQNQSVSIVEFLVNTVPNNIFKALSTANMLQIIIFCVIFSIACGAVSREDKKNRLKGLEPYIAVLNKINEKVLTFLPIGSLCLLGTQLSTVSDSVLGTILKLALVMLSTILSLAVLCSIITWRCSKMSYFASLKGLFETLIMAFSTQSSVVCIPKAVKSMTENLNFDKPTVELMIPLGVPLCQFSTICFYTIGTLFVVNIFNESLSFSNYVFVILASILTSFAASGVKGVVYYSLMAGILAPLGLPLGSTIALFIAVDPLVDPFGTIFHMYATCCSTAICCRWEEKTHKKLKKSAPKEIAVKK